MMKIIGLTGGIGSGKSTVSNYIKSQNILVLDADEISRNLTKKDGEALPYIREYFGDDVFFPDGELDRKKLANIVFNDSSKLKVLESFTTEIVNIIMLNKIEELRKSSYDGILLLDIPLLFESGDDSFCDETWVVVSSLENKIKRVMLRDNISKEEVIDRINNQMSDEDKMKRATHVIFNNGTLFDLYSKIDYLLGENS